MQRALFWVSFLSVAIIVIVLLSSRPDVEPQIQQSMSGDHLRIQQVLDLLKRYATDSERIDRKPVYPPHLFDLVPKYISEKDFNRFYLAEMRYKPVQARTEQRNTELISLRRGALELIGLENGTIIEWDGERK